MAVRRAKKEGLQRRVAALEARVRRLETPARRPRVPPVRAAPVRGPTSPGCSLALPRTRGAPRCVWCGFRLDAVAARPARRRRA